MVRRWANSGRSVRDFVEYVHSHVRARFEKPMFIEKSPTNVYNFRRFAERLPEVPLIHLIRDGRDAVASLQKRGFNLFSAGSRWLYDTLSGLQARHTPCYLEIRYEVLVREPQATLRQIFHHLGLNSEIDVLQLPSLDKSGVYTENWRERKEPSIWQQTPADPVSAASVGRYKTILSADELSTLGRIALTRRAAQELRVEPISFAQLLDSLGYEEPAPKANMARLGRRFEEALLELVEYNCRLSRFHAYRQWSLPPRYTHIIGNIA
jgi:hypothetical protein